MRVWTFFEAGGSCSGGRHREFGELVALSRSQ
jgi:hypothetical protein